MLSQNPSLHITNEREKHTNLPRFRSQQKYHLFNFSSESLLDPSLHPAAAGSAAASGATSAVRLLSGGLAAVGVSAHAAGTAAAPLGAASSAPERVVLRPSAGGGRTAGGVLCAHRLQRDVHRA